MTIPDRPTAAELVEAVREFLERDVFDATTGRVQFHTRVAVNALKMVERELHSPEIVAATEAARTAARDLAAQIRAGDLDDRLDSVRADVRADVRAKLLVANPGYLGEG